MKIKKLSDLKVGMQVRTSPRLVLESSVIAVSVAQSDRALGFEPRVEDSSPSGVTIEFDEPLAPTVGEAK